MGKNIIQLSINEQIKKGIEKPLFLFINDKQKLNFYIRKCVNVKTNPLIPINSFYLLGKKEGIELIEKLNEYREIYFKKDKIDFDSF